MSIEDRLDEVLDAWQAAAEAGRDIPVLELCRDCPDLVAEAELRVAVLRRVRGLASPSADVAPETRSLANTPAAASTGGPPTASLTPVTGPELPGFRLIRPLGKGGMGQVWEAEDVTLRRRVALKVMHPHVAEQENARERFLREARAAAAVHHDHVVPIFHVGESAGMPFLVMPLLAGESLETRLRREAAVPIAQAVRLTLEAAEGLEAAHAKGLVHRDVKPANLWLEAPSERVKVLDFGLARAADPADGLTCAGAVLGTPGYMAPEQAEGQAADARADLFSLGSVLYRLLTGRSAFAGKTVLAVLRGPTSDHDPPPPHELRPETPLCLSALTMRLLAKRPEDRPASARAVADELRRLETAGAVTDGNQASPPAGRTERGRLCFWVGAVAASAVAAAVLFLAVSSGWPRVEVGSAPPPTPIDREPLRVKDIAVHHFARRSEFEVQPRGVLGKDSFAAAEGDQVTVEVSLSRPGYAYLLACRPDGVVEVCFPEDESEAPPLTGRLTYPSKSRDVRYGLTDGAGEYAFAVVASDTPLPAYRDWVAGKVVSWRPDKVVGAVVWIDDGAWVDAVGPGGAVRGDRGKGERVPGQGAVVRLTDYLKGYGAVAAVGFVAGPRHQAYGPSHGRDRQ